MPVDVKVQTLKQFRDVSPWVALGALGVLLCAGIASSLFQTTLINRSIRLAAEDSLALDPIELTRRPIGALRIDVAAQIPTNRWITYEIALVDAQGSLLISAMKQAWRESGTWVEDGESGSWTEQDLRGGLDIRSSSGEPITIELKVLEYGTTAGQLLDESATLQLVVKNGVVDHRYFVVGAIATVILTIFSFHSVKRSGRSILNKSIADSDLGGREVMGGADTLLGIVVVVKSDETSPREFTVDLSIQNTTGEEIYTHQFNLNRGSKVNDSYRQRLETFFLIEPRDSYRVYVEVMPDGPVDRTRLMVKEGVQTVQPPTVTCIQS